MKYPGSETFLGDPIERRPVDVEVCVNSFKLELSARETGTKEAMREFGELMDEYAGAGDGTKNIPGMGPIVHEYMVMLGEHKLEPWKLHDYADEFRQKMEVMRQDPNLRNTPAFKELLDPILEHVDAIIGPDGMKQAA